MPRTLPTINIDRLVDAMVDTKTAHYWEIKRHRVIRDADDESDSGRTVLIDTINARSLRKIATDFAKVLDSAEAKLVSDTVKQGLDKLPKLLEKNPELKKEWYRACGRQLVEKAVAWLELQGQEQFSPTGTLAKLVKLKPAARKRAARDEEE